MAESTPLRSRVTKVHADNAAKQKAYRERCANRATTDVEFLAALVAGFDAAGCHKLVRGLDPQDPETFKRTLLERIEGKKVIVTAPETPEQRKARSKRSSDRKRAEAIASGPGLIALTVPYLVCSSMLDSRGMLASHHSVYGKIAEAKQNPHGGRRILVTPAEFKELVADAEYQRSVDEADEERTAYARFWSYLRDLAAKTTK